MTKRLEQAIANVLSHMDGCGVPGCSACRCVREAIDELVAAAREDESRKAL